jgi:hypothetical protein
MGKGKLFRRAVSVSGAYPAHPSSTSINYYYGVAAFVVVVSALVVAVGLFFALERVPNPAASAPLELRGSLAKAATNDGDVDGVISGPIVGVASARPARGAVDKDLDNDGTPDGVANALVGLASGLLCIPLLGGCLLLCLWELLKRGLEHYPALERPG